MCSSDLILSLLANIRPTQVCFSDILECVQTNRAQGDEGCSIDIACVTTAHRVFLLCMENLVCKKPTVWGFVIPGSGLKLFLGFPPPFVLDTPGRVGNLLAADLHRSIGLSAAPPSLWPGRELRKYHCLEVPGGCLYTFQSSPAWNLSRLQEKCIVFFLFSTLAWSTTFDLFLVLLVQLISNSGFNLLQIQNRLLQFSTNGYHIL